MDLTLFLLLTFASAKLQATYPFVINYFLFSLSLNDLSYFLLYYPIHLVLPSTVLQSVDGTVFLLQTVSNIM